MISDEGYTFVIETNVVDDTSKDFKNSGGIVGSAEGRWDNNGHAQNPVDHGTSILPSFGVLGSSGSP